MKPRLDKWLEKDEFESLADYQARIKNKEQKISDLMGEAFEMLSVWKDANISLYDAESQTFKLSAKGIGDMVIPVSKIRAKSFKEKFASFKFKPQFIRGSTGWTLSRLEMTGGGEVFIYDATKQAAYNPAVFAIKLDSTVDTSLAPNKEVKAEVQRIILPSAENIDVIPNFGAAKRADDIAIVIGIENYRGLPRSTYSQSDADLMRRYLRALGFHERNIAFLTNERATYIDIKKTLETWLRNVAKPTSRVIVYYSGHGAPDPVTGEGFIVPYDGDPEYLKDTAYSLKKLVTGLGDLKVKEALVIVDSCFSGAGGRSVLVKNARPLVAKSQEPTLDDGVALLTASGGDQISTSSEQFGHGVFTYYFLKALKDGKRSLTDVYSYMRPLVEDEARRQNVQQTPRLSPSADHVRGRFNLAGD